MKIVIAFTLLTLACVLGLPTDGVEPIDPQFDAYRDVRLLLQTRQNRLRPDEISFRNLISLQTSNFNRDRPTRFLVHGWLEDDGSDISTATSAELLDYYDFNVIFVDWSEGSQTINYIGAANRVPTVGQFIASQLDFMQEAGFLDFNRLALIGFSLGAHIVGMAGKNTRRGFINTIIGLDPAGPLFSTRNPEGRLDRLDGQYVEAIHTNGPTIVLVGAGIGHPIGDADFWPNGGSSQPGCLTNTCSHSRAVDFYVESIQDNSFYSLGCPAIDDISSRRCVITPGAWMGGDGANFNKGVRGSFYLETNRNYPFSQGPRRP